MSTPSFSVIIAVFNGAETIKRAIDSVLEQTCQPLEIIVIDDGSTDDTAEIVQQYQYPVRYHYQENAGVSVARNTGANLASGDWLAFLDADDWYYPDRLKWHADMISANSDLDFLTGNFDYTSPDGNILRSSMENTEAGRIVLKSCKDSMAVMTGETIGKFIEQHFGDTHTLSVPKKTFIQLGGYPDGIAVCEDVNFLIRLAAHSKKIGVICKPLAVYVIHEDSATRSDPLRAQSLTVEALLPLRKQLENTNTWIRQGIRGAIRHARKDKAYTLLRMGHRLRAIWSVLPVLVEYPGIGSIRDVLSIMKGMPEDQIDMKSLNSHLLVITELYLPTKGGTAVWFDEVYKRLGGKGIHILTADVPGAAEYDASHTNTVHRVSMKRYWWLKPESLAMYIKLFIKGLMTGIKYPVNAVHAGRVLPEGLVAWTVARLLRKPVVIYAHGEEITTWRQAGKFKAMVFTYFHANKVIANSEFTRNELLKLGIHPDNIILISPGVDIERFQPGLKYGDLRDSIGITDEQKLLLSVGRLSRRKGFDQIIKAMPALLKEGVDVHYAIIGIGEDQEYLTTLAKDNNVLDRVHLLGHVSMEDLPRWYNAADVFVMANREINGDTEGFGMVFIEAAACGKPAIAGKAGGTDAAVKDGVSGLRVEGSSLDEVTTALSRLLGDSDYAAQLGKNGLERVRNEFSWERVAEKTILIDVI